MGLSDRYLDLDLTPLGDSVVCSRCFTDYAIRRFIAKDGRRDNCSYCSRKNLKCVAIDELVEFLREGILAEYENAANCVGHRDGGYDLRWSDTSDLVYEIFEDEDLPESLRQDLAEGLPDYCWVERDPYAPTPDVGWLYDWEGFCRIVKHQSRYFFHRPVCNKRKDSEELGAYYILRNLGAFVRRLRLVRRLPLGTSFVRVRCHTKNASFSTATELAAPPIGFAVYSNRMSAAGIPMFYGAKDLRTAIAETFDPGTQSGYACSVGHFQLVQPLRVLDFTRLPEVPSLFDAKKRHLRNPPIFLRKFVHAISQPIARDGREHIEYVPTQIVTEYFRYQHRLNKGDRIDGLLYPSARYPGGVSCVLFVLNEESQPPTDGGWIPYQQKLELTRTEVIGPQRLKKMARETNSP
jgi:hypothetical protein